MIYIRFVIIIFIRMFHSFSVKIYFPLGKIIPTYSFCSSQRKFVLWFFLLIYRGRTKFHMLFCSYNSCILLFIVTGFLVEFLQIKSSGLQRTEFLVCFQSKSPFFFIFIAYLVCATLVILCLLIKRRKHGYLCLVPHLEGF